MTSKEDPGLVRPEPSQYLRVARSSMRYRLLIMLAKECGCTWQDVARVAIDDYLAQNPPLKKV